MEKKIIIAGLIAIIAIAAVAVFTGCIESTTTIYDIEEHPDKYISKRVTIEAHLGHWIMDPIYTRHSYHGLKGFWIKDKELPKGQLGGGSPGIFVEYSGDYPT